MRSFHFAVGAAPVEAAAQGARAFMQQHGVGSAGADPRGAVIAPTIQSKVAAAYQRLPSYDPAAVPAFAAMRDEVNRQFDHLTRPVHKGGMGIEVNTRDHDPYGGNDWTHVIPEARHDFTVNHRLDVLSSKATGGHPFFTNDENDRFRAVHDAFGHLAVGRGVDKHGEEAAFQAHAQMFSPLARGALAAETRGQNAVLHNTGSFGEQKVAVMPSMFNAPGLARLGSVQERALAAEQARGWNRRQGLTG